MNRKNVSRGTGRRCYSSFILHPFCSIDALRGGIRDAFAEGLAPQLNLRRYHASRIMG